MEIKILDTDKFFKDSPDAGEPNCICSRCNEQITEDEIPLRVSVDKEVLYAKNENTGRKVSKGVESANGCEFRLCEKCQAALGFYFKNSKNNN